MTSVWYTAECRRLHVADVYKWNVVFPVGTVVMRKVIIHITGRYEQRFVDDDTKYKWTVIFPVGTVVMHTVIIPVPGRYGKRFTDEDTKCFIDEDTKCHNAHAIRNNTAQYATLRTRT